MPFHPMLRSSTLLQRLPWLMIFTSELRGCRPVLHCIQIIFPLVEFPWIEMQDFKDPANITESGFHNETGLRLVFPIGISCDS